MISVSPFPARVVSGLFGIRRAGHSLRSRCGVRCRRRSRGGGHCVRGCYLELMLGSWGFRVRRVVASISWCTVVACGPEVAEEYPMCPKGPAPVCGEPCTHSCGCEFAIESIPHCQGDLIVTASSTCYQPIEVCAPGACVSPGSSEPVYCAKTCEQVKQGYYWALRTAAYAEPGGEGLAPGAYNVSSHCDDDQCAVNAGHCQQGLGICWFLGPKDPRLEQLASLHEQLGCPAEPACNCPEPPTNLECGPLPKEHWRGDIRAGCMVQ